MLVCTTVIEVGVDVPNATVMVVMDADWFGISQLHQLRGRIGRGAASQPLPAGDEAAGAVQGGRAAARRWPSTLDGFELADLDLAERREGDVLGRNQSGRAIALRLLSLARAPRDHRRRRATSASRPTRRDPGDPGLALLAAHFTDTERIEYLDKS